MGAVYLRALELDDAEQILKWHNDPELYRSLASPFRNVSRTTVEEWLRQKQGYLANEVNLAICRASDSVHIGNIYLRTIDWVARHAELHIFIGDPACQSKGHGREATRLLIDYAFRQLGLARVYLHVLADNARAIKMYQRCGLTIEGTLRRHAFKDGVFKDVVLMGICAGDPG